MNVHYAIREKIEETPELIERLMRGNARETFPVPKQTAHALKGASL